MYKARCHDLSFFIAIVWFFAIYLIAGAVGPAHADLGSDKLYINGFYTLDYTYTERDVGVVSNNKAPRSFDNDTTGLENSLMGLQAEYELNEEFSGFLQGKAFFNAEDELELDVNWAYLSYDFGDDRRLRIGKFQTPFLQGTELRNIGFTRIWARPLIPENGASGFNEYVGAEYLIHKPTAVGSWDFQLAGGLADNDDGDVDSQNVELVAAKYQFESFWIRTAFLHGQYNVSDSDGQRITSSGSVFMGSVEALLMTEHGVINAGYSSSRSDITEDDTLYYLSLAFPYKPITPFIYLGKRNKHFQYFDPPPPLPPQVGEPAPEPRIPPVGDYDVISVAFGARIYLREGLGLKLQLENIEQKNEAGAPTNAPVNDSNTFSILIEGVF